MKNPKNRVLSAFIALILSFSIPSHASAAECPYTDLGPWHWAYSAAMDAYENKVITGTSMDQVTGKATFSPDQPLTMAEFITILTRAFYSEEVEAAVSDSNEWWSRNDVVAKAKELYTGIPAKNMKAKISRGQMAVIMVNVLRDKSVDIPDSAALNETMGHIPDLSTAYPGYIDQIAVCYHFGILQGVDNAGNFAPNETVSRAVAASIYVRIRDFIAEASPLPPDENTIHIPVVVPPVLTK